MKYVKLLFVLSVAVLLSACDQSQSQKQRYTKNSFEYGGCKISYVFDPVLPNFYIARCETTTTITQTVSSGKSSYQQPIIMVESSTDLRKKLAEVEAREKALAKLSAEEKTILGVK